MYLRDFLLYTSNLPGLTIQQSKKNSKIQDSTNKSEALSKSGTFLSKAWIRGEDININKKNKKNPLNDTMKRKKDKSDETLTKTFGPFR